MLLALQDIMPTEEFEALAESILASQGRLRSALPELLSRLRPLLGILPDTSASVGNLRPQPRGQAPMPSADAMRRAANLVAAAAVHMSTIEPQVCLLLHLVLLLQALMSSSGCMSSAAGCAF